MSHPFDRLAGIGAYFALRLDVPDAGRDWRPVTDLLTQPAALDTAIDRVAARLGTSDRVIAASVLQQGWAARLTSVYTGTLTLGLPTPDLAAEQLHYHQPPTGPVDLALPQPVTFGPGPAWQHITAHLDELHDALRTRVRIARRLLWGNTAAAFAGSLRTLDRTGHARLDRLVRQPWANPPQLVSLGHWAPTPDGPTYLRRTCCGLERLPDRDPCRGCPLDRPANRRRPTVPSRSAG